MKSNASRLSGFFAVFRLFTSFSLIAASFSARSVLFAMILSVVSFTSTSLQADQPDESAMQPAAKESTVAETGSNTDNLQAAPAGSYLLRYKFQEGQTLRWEVVHRTRTRTTMKETTIVADMYSQSEKIWKVKKTLENGGALLENSVGWMNMWQETTGQSIVKYDSRTDKTVPDVYKGASHMLNVPLAQLEIDNRGATSKRKDFFPQTASQQLNPSQLTMPLPEQPLRVGEFWQIEKVLFIPKSGDVMLKVKTVQVYTLESVSNHVATIDFRTRILTPIHDPATEAQLVQCRIRGKIQFDLEQGRIIEQVQNLDHAVPHFSGQASTVRYINKFSEKWIGD